MRKISCFLFLAIFTSTFIFAQNFGDGPEYLETSNSSNIIRLQKKYDLLQEENKKLQTENKTINTKLTEYEAKIKNFEKSEKKLNEEKTSLISKKEELSKLNSEKDLEIISLKSEIKNLNETFRNELNNELKRSIEFRQSNVLIIRYVFYILLVLISFVVVIILCLKFPKVLKNKKDIQRYSELFYNQLQQVTYDEVLVSANSGGELALSGLDIAKRKFDIENNYKTLEEYKEQFNDIFEKKINNRINNFQEDINDTVVCHDYCEDLISYNDKLLKCCGDVKELEQKNIDLQNSKKDGIRQCLLNVSDRLEGIILRIKSLDSDDLEIKGLLEGVILSYSTTLKNLKEYIK